MEMLIPESKYPFVVFDNVADDSMFSCINNEINYLENFLQIPERTGTAFDDFGRPLKQNKGLWLTEFYNKNFGANFSPILNVMCKFFSHDVMSEVRNYSGVFHHFNRSRIDNELVDPFKGVLLSVYQEGDYYKPHHDVTLYTIVWWLNEKSDSRGGNFYFHFDDGTVEEVERKSNRAIIFPSDYKHEVSPISYLSSDSKPKYSVSLFFE